MAETEKKDIDEELEEIDTEEDQGGSKEDTTKTATKTDKTASDITTSTKTGKMFTQEQLNKMMAREKSQGRSSVLKDLGIDPNNQKMIDMAKAFFASQKTDEQKQTEQASESAIQMAEAQHRALVAEAKAEAMMLGVQPQFVEDAITLVTAKMTEDSDLKTLLGELKIKYPVWFEKIDGDEKSNKGKLGQKGTGSSIKASDNKRGKEESGMGARLAAQRTAGTKKTSFWGGNKAT